MSTAITTKMLVENALNGEYQEVDGYSVFGKLLDNDFIDVNNPELLLFKVFKVSDKDYLIVDVKLKQYLAMWRSWCHCGCAEPCSDGSLSFINWHNLIEWRRSIHEMLSEDWDDTYKLVNDETLIEIED